LFSIHANPGDFDTRSSAARIDSSPYALFAATLIANSERLNTTQSTPGLESSQLAFFPSLIWSLHFCVLKVPPNTGIPSTLPPVHRSNFTRFCELISILNQLDHADKLLIKSDMQNFEIECDQQTDFFTKNT
jgi:hypothetical protein